MSETYDVIIVGSGPSGASAAKALRGFGLKAAILEKRKLPRYKMCSGILLPYAHKFVSEHFGTVPENALSQPNHIKGLRLSLTIETPLADVPMNLIDNQAGPLECALNIKRPEFDYWLCKESGAAILDDCILTGVMRQREKLLLKVKRSGEDTEIEARYLVAADGSMSTVRKAVFPGFDQNVRLIPCYEEWYRGKIELEPGWLYAFYDRSFTGFMATVFHKDDQIIVSNGTAKREPAKHYFHKFHTYLKERHGLQVEEISERHGSVLTDMAATQNYCLGKENMLMVGEAAGFLRGTEGIGPALLSGRIAGESILKSAETEKRASDFYTQAIGPVIEACTKRHKAKETLAGYNIFTRK